jgi:hypothetical protein
MGHADHIGMKPEGPGDQINNGALDNSAGIATLLEVGRAFMTPAGRPRRSVLVVAHTAQALEMRDGRPDHAGHGGNRLQDDCAVTVPLGEEGVGAKAQSLCERERDAIRHAERRMVDSDIDEWSGLHDVRPLQWKAAPCCRFDKMLSTCMYQID